ncbi:Hydrogenase isoenzymes formation protein hypE [Raoultella terrigena]|uniref:Hydrogenase isoenzymes formation protein hypE n=1 Tax=Raoultella terrigena TaxID=577 RepID=A0A3P8M0N2_RAOTE|nr:Hydrogenase isoenzymes formation protein hypE [Raoultella terrigena]
MKSIQLAHGSGGQAMQQLIASLFMQAFANPWLAEQEDQARLDLAQLAAQGDRLAFSTDGYVIDPLFFPGGDIGKLAVCGTANDVAVSGALPRYLSCGFILEEGLEMATLEKGGQQHGADRAGGGHRHRHRRHQSRAARGGG